jgi:hypothetical protein
MKKLLRMFQSPAQGRSFVTVGDKEGAFTSLSPKFQSPAQGRSFVTNIPLSRIQYGFEFQSPAQGRSFVTNLDRRCTMKKLLRMFQSPAQGRSFVTKREHSSLSPKFRGAVLRDIVGRGHGRNHGVSIPCAGAVLRD